jgi:hypothetical protein
MDSPERAGTPTPSPLDAERARLRKEGFTDHTISQILLAREFATVAVANKNARIIWAVLRTGEPYRAAF